MKPIHFGLLLFCIALCASQADTQWVQTNGPYGGDAECFAVSSTNLFAGTYGGGVFLSTNNGTSWTAVNTSLTNPDVFALAFSGTNLFAGTPDGIWRRPLSEMITSVEPLPAGMYSIGTGGYFPTIDSAFRKLSVDGIAGPVTLELIDSLYQVEVDTFGFHLHGPIPGAGPNSRVTIRPAANRNVLIEGNWRFVVTFWNTSYVTLDGVGLTGATTLTVHSLINDEYAINRGVGFLDNSDHNVVQNVIVVCDNLLGDGDGIVLSVATTNSLFAPDSNLVQNNFIKKGGPAISIYATYASPNTRPIGNVIKGNFIGSGTDSLITWGIQVSKSQNAIIENNIVQNIRQQAFVSVITPGINSYSGNGDIIRNNVVHDIHSSGLRGSTGILLSGGLGDNNSVYNNMVYDIYSTSTQADSRVTGIQMWYQNNPKIFYNSVYLNGNGNGANPWGSAALYVSSSCTNVEAKNNILVNRRNESPYCASSIYDISASNLTSDNNDLHYEPNQYNCLVRAGGIDYHTLTEWQATGRDSHSVSMSPVFRDPYLHIANAPTLLDGGGTPIAGITTDFDGEPRNSVTPDIGADEFLITAVGEKNIGLPGSFALAQNYPNPFNPSTTIRYALPQSSFVTLTVYNTLGQQVARLVDEPRPAGVYTVRWDATGVSSGVYFYRLKAGDFVQTKRMILLR